MTYQLTGVIVSNRINSNLYKYSVAPARTARPARSASVADACNPNTSTLRFSKRLSRGQAVPSSSARSFCCFGNRSRRPALGL
jgi:hypothetical protein